MNKKIQLPKFNLQLFAEDNPEETPPTDEKIEDKEENKEEKQEEKKEEGKTFTQEELDKIIKDRLDRAMAKAEKERKQAEELAKLSEKERAAKELELKEKELEEERRLFQKERLELQTSKELTEMNLSTKFTKFVIGEDADTTFQNIKEFNSIWESEMEKRRIESMKGSTPRSGSKSGITKEEFEKMSITEKTNLFNTNKELYDKFTK